MPRKKRPSPPPPGSMPLRNIAAKPDLRRSHPDDSAGSEKAAETTLSSSRQSTAASEIESDTCGVPQCTIQNCRLATHLSYGRQRRLALNQSRTHLISSQSPPETLGEASSSLTIEPNMEEDFNLPVQDTAKQDFRKLFIQYFTSHFDRLILIHRPQRRDPAFKQATYRLALYNPVYCLTLVAQAHMGNIKNRNTPFEPATDHLTDFVYTSLLKMTREKVESFDLGDVDVLLLAIVALCEYDIVLDRYDALRSHHIGMSALVSKRGGIHNLGLSLPYVQRMDRFLAVRLNQIPQFTPPELPTSSVVVRKTADNLRFGSEFDQKPSSFSDDVLSLCSDAAQLLDLMDELNITFEPCKPLESLGPKLEYFYFLRENIDVRHAVLNHRCSAVTTSINKDLLALTATKIVTYYTASANYLPVVTGLLATRLWNLLTKAPSPASQGPSAAFALERSRSNASSSPAIDLSDWTDDMPTLLWLLFACALPRSRERNLSFASHIESGSTSSGMSRSGCDPSPPSLSLENTRATSRGRGAIISPSSPRRHRYLPSFLLHVAEHLVGERPLSGTTDWDEAVTGILEGFVWAGKRLSADFQSIMERVHEIVLARTEEDARSFGIS